MRLAGRLGGGTAAVLLATFFLGSLTLAGESGHLVWKPYRPSQAPARATRDSDSRGDSALAQPVAHEEEQAGASLARPVTFIATDPVPPRSAMPGPLPFDDPCRAQRLGDEQPLGLAAAPRRDPYVRPVQRIIAAEPIDNPFADEPETKTKTDKKSTSQPAELPAPGPASDVPTLPKSSSRDSTTDKSPFDDPFKNDTSKPKNDTPAKPKDDPFALPKTDTPPKKDDPFALPKTEPVPPVPPPSTPGNGLKTPITPSIPQTDLTPPSDDSTTGKKVCDQELANLLANTVDKVKLDITPQPTDEATRSQFKLPGECGLGDAQFVPREWSCITYTWKASALCHKPLYFEEVALERYGHSRGPILDPLVSAAHFFVTVPLLPYKMGLEPPCECEYSLGYYRPGDCAPWIIDGIPISLRGMALECTAVTGAAFAIP